MLAIVHQHGHGTDNVQVNSNPNKRSSQFLIVVVLRDGLRNIRDIILDSPGSLYISKSDPASTKNDAKIMTEKGIELYRFRNRKQQSSNSANKRLVVSSPLGTVVVVVILYNDNANISNKNDKKSGYDHTREEKRREIKFERTSITPLPSTAPGGTVIPALVVGHI